MSLDYLMDSELISPMQSSKSIAHLMSKDKRLDQIELPSETDHTETEPSQPKITMRFKPLDELEEKEEDFEVFDQKYLSRYRSRKVFKPKV